MSADGGSSSQPPPAAAPDKPQAAKPVATFSSFINKNTSGKKFAPKAARRRPAAAATAQTSKPTEPESTPAPSEPQTQRELSITTATEPAPTQEPAVENALQVEQSIPLPRPTTSEPTAVTPTPSAPVTAETTPAPPISRDNEVRQEEDSVSRGIRPAEEELVSERSPKRQRVAPSTAEGALPSPGPTPTTQDDATTTRPTLVQPSSVPAPQPEPADTTPQPQDSSTQEAEGDEAQAVSTQPLTQSRRRRRLPWVAVNQPQEDEESSVSSAKKGWQPAKPRGKKKATAAATDPSTRDQEDGDEEGDPQSTQTRPSAKARGKRRVDDTNTSEQDNMEVDAAAPARKPRKPRKDKGKKRAKATTEGGEEEAIQESEQPTEGPAPRKRKGRKRSTDTGEGEGEGEENAAPKRKGRPPREPTPSDAEDQVIDTGATFMDNLASRNIRVGRLSEREKRMRTIDWAEVRQRRREEEAKAIDTREAQDAVTRFLDEAGAARDEATQLSSGPQLREINGRIELVQDTGTIDRQADADRDIEAMEIVDEDDLTNRITARSFMKNNKRFPNDFILPGRGKRWTKDDTELFYKGLRMFGSDFAMIATLFPGTNRRSIKLKYNREEKENIERILEAKQNPIQVDWDAYLKVSQQEDDAFADADLIKQQLEEERQRMELQIEKAKEEVAERKRQEELAGAMGDGDATLNAKGRKKKGKQVAFQDDNVEILGGIDDDMTWGQE